MSGDLLTPSGPSCRRRKKAADLGLSTGVQAFDADALVGEIFEDMAREVNQDPKHPLTQLLNCLVDVVKDAGGIWRSSEPSAVRRLWEGMGLDLPTVFPSEQCWQDQTSDHEFLSDLLDQYSQREVDVYTSWEPDPLREARSLWCWNSSTCLMSLLRSMRRTWSAAARRCVFLRATAAHLHTLRAFRRRPT